MASRPSNPIINPFLFGSRDNQTHPRLSVTSSALVETRPIRCRRTWRPTRYWLFWSRKYTKYTNTVLACSVLACSVYVVVPVRDANELLVPSQFDADVLVTSVVEVQWCSCSSSLVECDNAPLKMATCVCFCAPRPPTPPPPTPPPPPHHRSPAPSG